MSTTHMRYQEGSLERIHRVKGPDVWVYRWRETVDGKRVQRKQIIGTLKQYPTQSKAKKAVENLRAEVNAQGDAMDRMTVRELWGHFQEHELRDPEVDRSPLTIDCYLINMRAHIIPRWGDCYLDEVKAVKVEQWFRTMKRHQKGEQSKGKKSYAPATKNKLRNQMSALFSHAIRHELWDKLNPIEKVRQGSKRLRIPDVLTLTEIAKILAKIDLVLQIAVLVAAVTGLRRSEIRGLKWSDIDFPNLWLSLNRGLVGKKETKMKTEASRRGIPITQDLADALLEWRKKSPYQAEGDWVFASPGQNGRNPIWLDTALRRSIRPAAVEAGITKLIGWHTFRRSLGSMLAQKKENIKVVQELLRHAHSSTTLDLYQQADADEKRMAQEHSKSLFIVERKAS